MLCATVNSPSAFTVALMDILCTSIFSKDLRKMIVLICHVKYCKNSDAFFT